jgi:Tol biopolymer transport system component
VLIFYLPTRARGRGARGKGRSGAKPPPPPPGTSNPEIGYIRTSGGTRRSYEFILSNEDGTGRSIIYSTREIGHMAVHMGPRADRTFALVQGGKISIGRYKQVATGLALDTLTEIYNGNHSGAIDAEFSRDGDSIVYMRNASMQIWRYDVSSGEERMLVDLATYGGGMSVSRDNSTVYYVESEGSTVAALKSVPMAGGTPTDLGLRGNYLDTEAANTKDELLLTEHFTGGDRLKRYDLASGSLTDVTNGYEPGYKCDDSRIVYVLNTGRDVSILYRDEPSGAPGTLSTSGLYWPDYIPTC